MNCEQDQPLAAFAPKIEDMDTDEDLDMPCASYIDRIIQGVETEGEDDSDEDYDDDSDGSDFELDMLIEDDSNDDAVKIKLGNHDMGTLKSSCRSSLSEEMKARLLWRLDKEESFSDWSIEVAVQKKGKESNKIYHVHRNVIAVGHKKSEYLESLVKKSAREHALYSKNEQWRLDESSDCTCRVIVSKTVAACFPDFLDYLYAHQTECRSIINGDNWFALHSLADYFTVPALTEAINDFIKECMSDPNHLAELLLNHQGSEGLDMLLPNAVKACTETILSIKDDSQLFGALSPAMLLHVMKSVRLSTNIDMLSSNQQYNICMLAIS